MKKHYANRDVMDLDKKGMYYCEHISAMTREGLHSKSDIAAELAYRDFEIDKLKSQLEAITKEQRDKFEDWVTRDSLHKESVLSKFNDGRYQVRSTQKQWQGWWACYQLMKGGE